MQGQSKNIVDTALLDAARAKACALLAIILGGVGMLGWLNGNVMPGGVVGAGHAANPLALLAFAALAAAVVASIRSWTRVRGVFLAIPTLIVTLALLRYTPASDFGERVIPTHPIDWPTASAPIGQPYADSPVTLAILAMLTLAVAVVDRPGRNASAVIIGLASMALGVSTICGIVILAHLDGVDREARALLPALLPVAQAVPVAIALFIWRGRFGWPDILALDSTPRRMFRRAFPIVVLAPGLMTLFDIFITFDTLSPLIADIVMAAGNIAILVALMLWSTAIVSAEHVALADATTAIRREREAELLEQTELLQAILLTVPSALVVFDERGIIKAFSASAERMFGHTARQAIGRDVEMLASGPGRDAIAAHVERYLTTGERDVRDGSRPLYARRSDGTIIPAELWLGHMQAGPNRVFIGCWTDISTRMADAQRMAAMQSELLHVSRLSAIGEMAAGLAHELNQPLAALIYFLGAIEHLPDNDTNRDRGLALVRMASEQALRTGEIVRRMRSFVGNDTGEMREEQIAAILDDAIAVTFLAGGRHDIQLVFDLDPAAVSVLADRVQIQQVCVNLLRNAMEKLRKSPSARHVITIATRLVDLETVAFSIADTGPGIDPKVIEHLGMPFVTTKGANGMGLGLSISRRIIEAHGGTLSAANRPEGGAIFSFTLPHIGA